jgi:hypothetical protein
MRLRFTIRQTVILIANVAIVLAVATSVTRAEPSGPLWAAFAFLMAPWSLMLLLRLFDRPGRFWKRPPWWLLLYMAASCLAFMVWELTFLNVLESLETDKPKRGILPQIMI